MTEEITLSAEMQAQTLASLMKELVEESSARNYRFVLVLRQASQDKGRVRADLSKRQYRLEQLQSR